ncbi:4'-phosphopantetheinyl transferase superfamily protein [Christiangramia echinicola]|uniref:Phosphopantetheine--protein transferase domain-containing protein n=1 Tax=Christiangramia echinicola TaxID=279359 RepID=A0A1H1RW47_9FLAO|nr:4'-phosphopantetheinyl transferase superfamily protein [Christiangramia echinicola]SDS39209.1 phosphopantetheine--protein transferase domain-containing protein [Christiangramia echinicola]
MIGNDIIDLKIARAEGKSDNIRFIDKVFTEFERSLILNSQDPELHLWILWSMKEAAYKAHQRIYDLPRKLNPRTFGCKYIHQENSGKVSIGSIEYSIDVLTTSEYIHSITSSGALLQMAFFNGQTSRSELLARFLSINSIEMDEIKLYKDFNGVPSIPLKNSPKKLPISLSHHGNFTAFAIPLINS